MTDVGTKLNERWGQLLGSAHIYIIQLENEKQELIEQVRELTENEKRYVENIHSIEKELLILKEKVEDQEKSTLSPEAREIAEKARKIINSE